MYSIVDFLHGIDWASPQVAAVIVLLTILSILRKWFLLTLTLLVITLGRGLCYLAMNRQLLADTHLSVVTIVYFTGGTFITAVASVQFLWRN